MARNFKAALCGMIFGAATLFAASTAIAHHEQINSISHSGGVFQNTGDNGWINQRHDGQTVAYQFMGQNGPMMTLMGEDGTQLQLDMERNVVLYASPDVQEAYPIALITAVNGAGTGYSDAATETASAGGLGHGHSHGENNVQTASFAANSSGGSCVNANFSFNPKGLTRLTGCAGGSGFTIHDHCVCAGIVEDSCSQIGQFLSSGGNEVGECRPSN